MPMYKIIKINTFFILIQVAYVNSYSLSIRKYFQCPLQKKKKKKKKKKDVPDKYLQA
jgi:hypothetical protein